MVSRSVDPLIFIGPRRPQIDFTLATAGGFRARMNSSDAGLVFGSDGPAGLRLRVALDPREMDLSLGLAVGRFTYTRDGGVGSEGFDADMVRVADSSGFPVPEPSTMAMGAIGVGMLGLAEVRRRHRHRRAAA